VIYNTKEEKEESKPFDMNDICPIKLFEKYDRDCVNHLDEERTP
jgi:hypothetical protein